MTRKELLERVNSILEQASSMLELEANPETIDQVLYLINRIGRRQLTGRRPKMIEVDGKSYRWCNRHQQYEPLEWFPKNPRRSDGYGPECLPARLRWEWYNKEIHKAMEEKNAAKVGELSLLRRYPEGYDLKKDIEDFKDQLKNSKPKSTLIK